MPIAAAVAETKPAVITNAPPHVARHLQKLPPVASKKYEGLRRATVRARSLIEGLRSELDRARETRDQMQTELEVLDPAHPATFEFEECPDGGRRRVPSGRPVREALVASLDAAKDEIRRLQQEQQAIVRPNIEALEDWIARLDHSAKFVPARVPPVKISKSETVAGALGKVLGDQKRIEALIAKIQDAPRTTEEAKQGLRAQIEALAARGRPDVMPLFDGDLVNWPRLQVIGGGAGLHQYSVVSEVADTEAVFAWLHRDALVAALDKEVETARADDADALSAEEQNAQLSQLTAALLVLQHQGEALISQLEGDGIPVKRTCTLPEVLLGIEPAK
jgi:hypothetical protein